jgi:uncharacterized phage-associated protein
MSYGMAREGLGYTAPEIAKWFINATDREAGDSITHLKVQKLVYYAQGWALALLQRPLFDEDLMAWTHGPVARTVYDNYRGNGFDALPPQKRTRKIGGDAALLLESVNEKYCVFSAKQLERMTHNEIPWKETRGDLPLLARSELPILKDTMESFFLKMAARGNKKKQ